MKGAIAILFILLSTSLVYAANLTSCISPSLVTCPNGATVHNIGSCPNGFVLWGCQYQNGTVVYSGLPNSSETSTSTTVISTTVASTTVPSTTLPSTNVSSTTISAPAPITVPPTKTPPSSSNIILYSSIVVVLIIVIVLYYIFVSKRKVVS